MDLSYPSEAGIKQATDMAGMQSYPNLPHLELMWSKFVGKRGISIFCFVCDVWVGWALLNINVYPPKRELDTDGQCIHYDIDATKTLSLIHI